MERSQAPSGGTCGFAESDVWWCLQIWDTPRFASAFTPTTLFVSSRGRRCINPDQTPERIVKTFVEHINRADLDGIAALTALTYTFTDMEGEVYVIEGATAIKESWDEYCSAYPEYKILVDHVLRSGDGVAVVGRTTGSHLALEVERDEVVLWIAEIVDGLIAGWRIYSTLVCEDKSQPTA